MRSLRTFLRTQRELNRLPRPRRDQARLTDLHRRPPFHAADLRLPPLPDAIDELLDHPDMRVQSDGRLRLLEVIETLGRVDPLPFAALAQVEGLEVLQVE